MPLPVIAPADVPTLIPGAPPPEQAHLDLASIWLTQQLAGRGVSVDTAWTDAQVTLLKTALAARALALKAGLGGVITLTGAAQGVNQVKIGSIEVKLTGDSNGNARVAAADWDAFALQFLWLLFPRAGRAAFAGVSR